MVNGGGIKKLISAFLAYPNTNSGKFTLTFNSQAKLKLMMKVLDMPGNELLIETVETIERFNFKNIDLTRHASGIYFLKIETKNAETRNLKIIIE